MWLAMHAIMYPPLAATWSTQIVSGIFALLIRPNCDAAKP